MNVAIKMQMTRIFYFFLHKTHLYFCITHFFLHKTHFFLHKTHFFIFTLWHMSFYFRITDMLIWNVSLRHISTSIKRYCINIWNAKNWEKTKTYLNILAESYILWALESFWNMIVKIQQGRIKWEYFYLILPRRIFTTIFHLNICIHIRLIHWTCVP